MRNIILVALLFLFPVLTIAQSKYQEKIESLEQKKEAALEEEDYIEVNYYEKQIEILKELQEAVKNEDYEKAAEKQLEYDDFLTSYKNNAYKHYYNPDVQKRHFYLELMPFSMSFWDFSTSVGNEISFSPGLELGHTFYFKTLNKNHRFGFNLCYAFVNADIQFIDNPLPDGVKFGVARTGLTYTYYLPDSKGLDVKFNLSPIYAFTGQNGYEGIGLNLGLNTKFWFSNFALGINYNYGYFNAYKTNMNQIAIHAGFRFGNHE